MLRLPYGPWYPLFSGKYEGTDVSLYQNPDRDFLSVVVDADEKGRPRGLVLTMYRGFLAEGPVQQLLESLRQNAYLFMTKRGDEVHRFLLIVKGPRYVGVLTEELRKALEEMGNALYRETVVVRELGKAMSVTLTALRDVPKRVAALLLAEPLVLPKMTGAKTAEVAVEVPHVALGKTREGLVAKEPVTEFRFVTVTGEHEKGRKRAVRILVEGYALAGIPVIVLTKEAEAYEGMKNAGSAKLAEYGLAPVGFPVSIVSPGKGAFLDLNVVDMGALADLLGVSPSADVVKVLGQARERGKGGIEGIDDLRRLVEGNQYAPLQARRVLDVAKKKYGGVFSKNTATHFLVATEIGGITVVEMREDVLHPLVAHTVLEVVAEFLRRRGKKGGVAVVVEGADRIVPRVDSPVVRALVSSLRKLADQKAYIALEAESEAYIDESLVSKVETRITTVSDEEVGIRMLTKRPYRFTLRPFASSITV